MQQTVQDLEIWPKERDKTWTITKITEKMIEVTYMRMLRAALNVSWRDHVTYKGPFQMCQLRSGEGG